jgi:hypothetical protein
MHSIYDQLFHYKHLEITTVDIEKEKVAEEEEEEIKSFVDAQRARFHQLISGQRALVGTVALEPTLWWFYNSFSSTRHETLVAQECDVFFMLHNIDAIVSLGKIL